MLRERFISWPCVLIFLLPFCQMGVMQNVPPPGVALGMESGAILDSSLTASYVHPNYGPERARLNTGRVWYGGNTHLSTQQWIQVDLSTTYRITGVATQGRQNRNHYVTSFKVACSIDGITFDTVQGALNESVADKVFVGNTDANTVVYNTLPSVKVCRYVRLLPITFHSEPALRMELYGEGPVPGALQNVPPPGVPLGMESGAIPDSSLTASYVLSGFGPEKARLNAGTAWFGGRNITHQQWIQVDLSTTYRITGVATQGRRHINHWVTSFKVACSIDGITFDIVQDALNDPVADKVFVGNTDNDTVVYNALPSVRVCRYVRLLPITANVVTGLRMELYGEGRVPVDTPSNPTTVRETTTSNPTTVRETITSNPTTVRQTTTSNTTTVGQTTTSNLTTVKQTTAANPTTVRQTTTPNPTTVGQTTTSNPTTVRQTTTSNTTTVGQTTTSNLTMVKQTTAANPTTVRQTTTSNPTTVRQTTTPNPTTVRQTTTPNPTTVRQTSVSVSTHTTTLSPIKGAIDEILNETITVDNLDIVSVELANVTEDSNKFDVEDLQSVTDKLSSIVEFASNQNLTEEVIVQVSVSVIGAVDNILNIPESTFETASSQQVSKTKNILTTISTLTENIQKASAKNFTYSGSNIVLAAVKVDRRKFPLTTAIGGAMDDVIDFSANEGSPSNAAGVTSVYLPEAILPSVSSTNQVISVSVFLLNSPKLFQGDRPSSSSTPSSGDKQNQQPKTVSVVASPILTVTIEGIDIKDLPDNESIVFVFPVNQTLIREEIDAEVSQRCVYWDIDLGAWSDEGCKTEKTALQGMVSCRCSHLTSFAVLLDIKGSIISKALDVISRIGCIASIICLVITLCILLGFRKLRRKQPQQILINLSFALLALYVTFVIGIDRPTWRISCTVVAILLHYFCLASLAWMGVEAFNMYMMFVRVLNSYIPKFLLKCSMIGWGIPLIVVIIAVASKWTAYQNYEYCFILPGYSLYFGLILPIGLILSFNGIIFAMVLYKLSCGRISTSKSSTLESKKENIIRARMEAIRRAQNAVAIGTLMGLTWAFGFLSFGGGRYLFNVLFTIFNSLQGVFVFLLFGIRQPELREKLKMTKKRFLHGASSARRRSSEFWASSSGARITQRPSDVTFISMVKTDSVAEGQATTHFESTPDTGPPLNKE